jgi:hypothetical protein
MPSDTLPSPISKKALWAGWILSVLPALLLIFSAVMKFLAPPSVVQGFVHLGYPAGIAFGLGIIELACTAVYLIPCTSVLGAILLTGYLGGATASTLRVGDPYLMTPILGVLLWGGLYLRDPRLRVLIPLRRCPSAAGN